MTTEEDAQDGRGMEAASIGAFVDRGEEAEVDEGVDEFARPGVLHVQVCGRVAHGEGRRRDGQVDECVRIGGAEA